MDEREELVRDACYMEAKEAIGDYAPLHTALTFIANQIEEAGLSPRGVRGKICLLVWQRICSARFPDGSQSMASVLFLWG